MELIVAMALTAIFAASCVLLMVPVSKIYTHVNELSRAQLVADTVVDSLRAECARTTITDTGDVWIASSGNSITDAHESRTTGPVLVMRKSSEYCETIFSNSAITADNCTAILEADEEYLNENNTTSRAVYRLFESGDEGYSAIGSDVDAGYVHFGYFNATVDSDNYVCPAIFYDFTNPCMAAAYQDYTVELSFSNLTYSGSMPAFVECAVRIMKSTKNGTVEIYSRDVVLRFASSGA